MLLGVALTLATAGCKQSEPRTGELFQAQSRGLGYLELGQLPEAEAQFKTVISLAPKEPLGYANLGLTYLRASRFADAETQLRKARDLDPTNADVGLMLAKLYAVTGRVSDARATLEQLRKSAPTNAHALYALAELDRQAMQTDTAAAARYEARLRDVMGVAPMNLAVQLELIQALVRRDAADSALKRLEDVRRVGPEIPPDAKPALDSAIDRLRAGRVAEAKEPLDRFGRAMELTSPYQASLDTVKWLEGPLAGRPVLSFTPKFIGTLRGASRRKSAQEVRFVDVTADAGLPEPSATVAPSSAASTVATGDYDGDGIDDVFTSGWSAAEGKAVAHLYHVQGGQFLDVTARSGISLPAGAVFATFADVDNDGRLDLFAIGGDQRAYLFRNRGDGRFEDVSAKAGITNVSGARKAFLADLDHDGDLDLFVVGTPRPLIYRNNLDGTFTEVSQAMGLVTGDYAAGPFVPRDAAFADFDGDGRMDVLVVSETGPAALYHNEGGRKFAVAKSGLALTGASAVAAADYNNDGFIDVFVAGPTSGESSLWLNNGNGTFRRDTRSSAAMQALRGLAATDAKFIDYDNDGWLDLVVVGAPSAGGHGVRLLHNDGHGAFTDASSLIPASVQSPTTVEASDVNGDGGLDLIVADRGGTRLLRNIGGNANLSMQVQLLGLRTGSGKNNDFGIGARVEVRAAELYQTRVVTSRVTHFGLGPHLKADVIRIEWPNGVPQSIYFPGTDQDVIENEILKGSCAFLYTWDGTRFRFVTDVMWRSALGMPLGLMAGGAAAYAPAGASQEYLRIPGDALRPRNGKYTLQLTEELWETAYADQLQLLAVDHPDSVDVFVDERFVPPGPVALRLFTVAKRHPPLSAVDDRGNDLLPALRDKDDRYVSNLTPLRYQGLVEPHALVMDLGADAGADSSFLFLRGWIYPTDASINVALSQQSQLAPTMPTLEVRDARGTWRVVQTLGFPSGKDKTMVIPLSGIFPTADHHVRIRTNLQIYWDQAFVGRDVASSATRITRLHAASANLHFRGYSRTYRKGGRYGPWWFDYDSVTTTPMWRPIEGAFTRFGDVLPLLESSDDMYVIMAPGDEATLEFDAASSDSVPRGGTRDFLLYSDGWIKDSDLNTAYGTTVGPLPFHAIRQYPYARGDAYPSDSAHQRYLRQYNTRVVSRRAGHQE
jgi:Tfp pilus assembly protein PilF